MLPSNIRQITSEGFKPEERELIDRLGGVLNYFMRQTIEILTNNVDFDNLTWDIIEFTATCTGGVPNGDLRISSNVENPKGFIIVSARNVTNSANYLDNGPFLSFTPLGQGLAEINHITGLRDNEQYSITAIVI